MARALAAAVIAGLALGVGGAAGKPDGPQKCLYFIVYDGSVYQHVTRADVIRGARVGRATRPGCNDIGGPPPPDKPVEVFRFGKASPLVALTVREKRQADSIVAVQGRCVGLAIRREFLRCLQAEVRYRGRGYAVAGGPPLPRARPLGRGSLRGRPVRLEALDGIDPRIALVRRDQPRQTFVEHRRCELYPSDPYFLRCLRSPLWLEIGGQGRLRTATVDRPGSLLRAVELPLFLVPEAAVDEIASPDDDRLAPAGRLRVDRAGRGSTRIVIVDTVQWGLHAVVAALPNRRVAVVGTLFVSDSRRD